MDGEEYAMKRERDIDTVIADELPEPRVEEIEQAWVALCCCSHASDVDAD